MNRASQGRAGAPSAAPAEDLRSALESGSFPITVEVLPPMGGNAGPLLETLEGLAHLPFLGYSVATNPVAKPRMSALALSTLLQARTGKPAVLHCTTRDHNRLGIQSLLWGATALGIRSVLVTTGDYVAIGAQVRATPVRDIGVYDLLAMSSEAGHFTGAALGPQPEAGNLQQEVRRLERKVRAGARFAVTQPVFDPDQARALHRATQQTDIPILLGILPLRTARHAEFLNNQVAGIRVPNHVRQCLERAVDPGAEGTAAAREMLEIARQHFAGACIMPAFGHYEILAEILV